MEYKLIVVGIVVTGISIVYAVKSYKKFDNRSNTHSLSWDEIIKICDHNVLTKMCVVVGITVMCIGFTMIVLKILIAL